MRPAKNYWTIHRDENRLSSGQVHLPRRELELLKGDQHVPVSHGTGLYPYPSLNEKSKQFLCPNGGPGLDSKYTIIEFIDTNMLNFILNTRIHILCMITASWIHVWSPKFIDLNPNLNWVLNYMLIQMWEYHSLFSPSKFWLFHVFGNPFWSVPNHPFSNELNY